MANLCTSSPDPPSPQKSTAPFLSCKYEVTYTDLVSAHAGEERCYVLFLGRERAAGVPVAGMWSPHLPQCHIDELSKCVPIPVPVTFGTEHLPVLPSWILASAVIHSARVEKNQSVLVVAPISSQSVCLLLMLEVNGFTVAGYRDKFWHLDGVLTRKQLLCQRNPRDEAFCFDIVIVWTDCYTDTTAALDYLSASGRVAIVSKDAETVNLLRPVTPTNISISYIGHADDLIAQHLGEIWSLGVPYLFSTKELEGNICEEIIACGNMQTPTHWMQSQQSVVFKGHVSLRHFLTALQTSPDVLSSAVPGLEEEDYASLVDLLLAFPSIDEKGDEDLTSSDLADLPLPSEQQQSSPIAPVKAPVICSNQSPKGTGYVSLGLSQPDSECSDTALSPATDVLASVSPSHSPAFWNQDPPTHTGRSNYAEIYPSDCEMQGERYFNMKDFSTDTLESDFSDWSFNYQQCAARHSEQMCALDTEEDILYTENSDTAADRDLENKLCVDMDSQNTNSAAADNPPCDIDLAAVKDYVMGVILRAVEKFKLQTEHLNSEADRAEQVQETVDQPPCDIDQTVTRYVADLVGNAMKQAESELQNKSEGELVKGCRDKLLSESVTTDVPDPGDVELTSDAFACVHAELATEAPACGDAESISTSKDISGKIRHMSSKAAAPTPLHEVVGTPTNTGVYDSQNKAEPYAAESFATNSDMSSKSGPTSLGEVVGTPTNTGVDDSHDEPEIFRGDSDEDSGSTPKADSNSSSNSSFDESWESIPQDDHPDLSTKQIQELADAMMEPVEEGDDERDKEIARDMNVIVSLQESIEILDIESEPPDTTCRDQGNTVKDTNINPMSPILPSTQYGASRAVTQESRSSSASPAFIVTSSSSPPRESYTSSSPYSVPSSEAQSADHSPQESQLMKVECIVQQFDEAGTWHQLQKQCQWESVTVTGIDTLPPVTTSSGHTSVDLQVPESSDQDNSSQASGSTVLQSHSVSELSIQDRSSQRSENQMHSSSRGDAEQAGSTPASDGPKTSTEYLTKTGETKMVQDVTQGDQHAAEGASPARNEQSPISAPEPGPSDSGEESVGLESIDDLSPVSQRMSRRRKKQPREERDMKKKASNPQSPPSPTKKDMKAARCALALPAHKQVSAQRRGKVDSQPPKHLARKKKVAASLEQRKAVLVTKEDSSSADVESLSSSSGQAGTQTGCLRKDSCSKDNVKSPKDSGFKDSGKSPRDSGSKDSIRSLRDSGSSVKGSRDSGSKDSIRSPKDSASNDCMKSPRDTSSKDSVKRPRDSGSSDSVKSPKESGSKDSIKSTRDLSFKDSLKSPRDFSSKDSVKSPRDSGSSVKNPRDSGSKDSVKSLRDFGSKDSVKSSRDFSSKDSVKNPRDRGSKDSVKSPRDSASKDSVKSPRDRASKDSVKSPRASASKDGSKSTRDSNSEGALKSPIELMRSPQQEKDSSYHEAMSPLFTDQMTDSTKKKKFEIAFADRLLADKQTHSQAVDSAGESKFNRSFNYQQAGSQAADCTRDTKHEIILPVEAAPLVRSPVSISEANAGLMQSPVFIGEDNGSLTDSDLFASSDQTNWKLKSFQQVWSAKAESFQCNPLTLTPPSAQLHGGRCQHKRVNSFQQVWSDEAAASLQEILFDKTTTPLHETNTPLDKINAPSEVTGIPLERKCSLEDDRLPWLGPLIPSDDEATLQMEIRARGIDAQKQWASLPVAKDPEPEDSEDEVSITAEPSEHCDRTAGSLSHNPNSLPFGDDPGSPDIQNKYSSAVESLKDLSVRAVESLRDHSDSLLTEVDAASSDDEKKWSRAAESGRSHFDRSAVSSDHFGMATVSTDSLHPLDEQKRRVSFAHSSSKKLEENRSPPSLPVQESLVPRVPEIGVLTTSVVQLLAEPFPGCATCRPLYFIHPVTGSLDIFQELATMVGTRCIGIRRSGDVPTTCIEDVARYYCSAIMKHDLYGPYYLTGYSYGGLLAFEMARVFQKEGRRVEMLLMIDGSPHYIKEQISSSHSHLPPDVSMDRVQAVTEAHFLMYFIGLYTSVGNKTLMRAVIERKYTTEERIHAAVGFTMDSRSSSGSARSRWLRRRQSKAGPDQQGVSIQSLADDFISMRRNQKALEFLTAVSLADKFDVHAGHKFIGDIQLIRIKKTPEYAATLPADYGLSDLCSGSVRVHYVEGDHESVMRSPHVQSLAAVVQSLLRAITKTK